MDLDLQLFAEESGPQEPQIPEELLGLPNQELVKEILEEENPAGGESAGAEDNPPADGAVDPDFWKKKAEDMEKAMYEERAKRKNLRRDLDNLNKVVLKLQQNQISALTPKQEEEYIDPLVQEAVIRAKQEWSADPALQEVRGYVQAQREQRLVLQRAEEAEAQARQKYADFDEISGPIIEVARQNPDLARFILTQDDPGEVAYTLGIRYKFEAERQEAQARTTEKLGQIAKHPRAGQVRGAAAVATAEIDPDAMTADEWDKLDPKVRKKLLMGG